MNIAAWEYLRVASQYAKFRNGDRRKFAVGALAIRRDGAVVVSRNEAARNVTPHGHAEWRVLQKAGTGAILYVARVRRNGSMGLARPCKFCQSMIKSRRVKKVYYTIDDNTFLSEAPHVLSLPRGSTGDQ